MRKKLNGEGADVVAEKGKERIAIEIETGNSNAIENIKKCLDAGFDLIISVPVNKRIEAHISERLKKEQLDRRERVLIINSERFERLVGPRVRVFARHEAFRHSQAE